MSRWGRAAHTLTLGRDADVMAFAVALAGEPHARHLADAAVARVLRRWRAPRDADESLYEAQVAMARLWVSEKARCHVLSGADEAIATPEADVDPAPTDPAIDALADLAPFERACALLFYGADVDAATIAHRLRRSQRSVRRALASAGDHLRERLGAEPDAERVEIVAAPGPKGGR